MHRHLARIRAQGIGASLRYLVVTVLLEKVGLHVDCVFLLRAVPPPDESGRVSALVEFTSLSPADIVAIRAYGGEALVEDFAAAFSRGEVCAVARTAGGDLASVCWLQPVVPHRALNLGACSVIQRCFTMPQHRGAGLYARTISHACAWIREQKGASWPVVIESSWGNVASIRGIEKAGFERAALAIRAGRWERAWPGRA